MTGLYGAKGSFVLLRSKNGVNILTQSAENRICMGKWAFEIVAELFLKNKKASDDRTFFTQCVRYHSPGLKRFHQESSSMDEETIHELKSKFSFFAKMTSILRPLRPTLGLGQSSIASPIWSVEDKWWHVGISHQGEFIFCHLAGGRNIYAK